jgi:hypothetical protein
MFHERNRLKFGLAKTLIVGGAPVLLLLLLKPAPKTFAIPAFARKYQTSCSTCHSNFPELNDFGEAFKKAGFNFPKDDETFVKEPPVLLGAEEQRENFPDVIYPGEIPGTIPISFRFLGFGSFNNRRPLSAGVVPRTDLFTPDTVVLIGAGSFGKNLSFWVDDDLSVEGSGAEGGLGDGYLKVNDLGHYLGLPKDALNLRFGQFELDLPFTQARSINPTSYDIYDQASVAGGLGTTDNPLLFGEPQRGVEIGGYPNDGNFSWSLALVNGTNADATMRSSKDIYARVSQRFNLERDAKARKEVQAASKTGPRDHTSLRLGAFYYRGRNELNLDRELFPEFGTIKERFYRAGADFRFKYRKFEVYGLGMHGRDQNLIPDEETGLVEKGPPVTFTGGFAQAQYWFYPWVIGIMRYDVVNSPTDFQNGASVHNTRNRFSPGLQILVRGNIKTVFEYQRRWQQVVDTSERFRANSFVFGVDYVF